MMARAGAATASGGAGFCLRRGPRLLIAALLLALGSPLGAQWTRPGAFRAEPETPAERESDARAGSPLFRITTWDSGIQAFDLAITETRREPRVSELRVQGFHARNEAGSRWLMCMFNTLAILRGFEYWTAVYPSGSDETVLIGFPTGPRDKLAEADPRFASRWSIGVVAPIERGVRLCKRTGS